MAAARAAGVTGQVVSVPAGTDVFSVAAEANTILRAERIRLATGWRPRHNNLLDSINLYAQVCQGIHVTAGELSGTDTHNAASSMHSLNKRVSDSCQVKALDSALQTSHTVCESDGILRSVLP